jgi:hypothetical protein
VRHRTIPAWYWAIACVLWGAATWPAPPSCGDDQPPKAVADGELVALIDRLVAERQPPESDKRFDEIGWSRQIIPAQKLAGEHRRPLFLFTHDGRMNIGRC